MLFSSVNVNFDYSGLQTLSIISWYSVDCLLKGRRINRRFNSKQSPSYTEHMAELRPLRIMVDCRHCNVGVVIISSIHQQVETN